MSTRRLIFLVLALVAGVVLTVSWYLEADRVQPSAIPSGDAAPGATESGPAGALESGQADARSWRPPRLRPLTRSRRPEFLGSRNEPDRGEQAACLGELPAISMIERL